MDVYEELLEKSGLTESDLDKKMQKVIKKNPDLNKEIAAFFLAKELGIEIDDSKLVITPLNLLEENTKNANILVSVDKIFPKKEFTSENRKGTVQNAYVTDNTARLQLSLWNYDGQIRQGDVILVTNCYVNTFKGEKKLNTSRLSTTKIKTASKIERVYNEKKLFELQDKDTNLSVIGTVVQKGDIKEFERDGQTKSVLRFVISDAGFQNNCVAWGKAVPEAEKLLENNKIKIENCYAKLNRGQMELHLNDFSKMTLLEENAKPYVAPSKQISELAYNEMCEIHAKIKNIIQSRYIKICKVCNNPMMKLEEKYFCSVCNAEQESFTKASANLVFEDDSGTTNAILTKKILVQLLSCDETDLENKLIQTSFEGLEINCVGYLRKTRDGNSEFFVNNLI